MTSDSRPLNASPHFTLQSDIDAEECDSPRTGNWRPNPAPRTHSAFNQTDGADSLNLRAAGWQNPTTRIITTPSHMSETTPVREHTEGNCRPIPAPRTRCVFNQTDGADSLNLRAAENRRPNPAPRTHSAFNQTDGADSLNLRAAGWQNPTTRIITTPSHMSETTPVREHTEDGQSGAVVLWTQTTNEQAPANVLNMYKKLEHFVILFPVLKKRIKQSIVDLQTVADDIDTCHRNASIATIVGSGASAVGGTAAMVGLLAAPFTGGASLYFTGAALVGGFTSTTACITEAYANKGHQKKVDEILERYNIDSQELMESFKGAYGAIECLTKLSQVEMAAGLAKRLGIRPISVGYNSYRLVSTVLARKALEEMSVLQGLATKVSALLGSLQSGNFVDSMGYVKSLLFGKPLVVTNCAWVATAALSTAFVAWDVYSLVTETMNLHKGNKKELAQRVQNKAEEIEGKLKIVQQIFEALEQFLEESNEGGMLQNSLTTPPTRPMISQPTL
ncbi:apolipoprotein L6-like isoform X2 [Carcharodon carcharias]|uniref:apolipoprotein L6-like isoform X2 n=1 Tax=Carcharodon carcharias TaxID=13397 RepID=UPI001B7E8198|nr:apolipoprotein L6-like isoform X2 [Carcharodon carcharias]